MAAPHGGLLCFAVGAEVLACASRAMHAAHLPSADDLGLVTTGGMFTAHRMPASLPQITMGLWGGLEQELYTVAEETARFSVSHVRAAAAATLRAMAASAGRLSSRLRHLPDALRSQTIIAIIANLAVSGMFPLTGTDMGATAAWLNSLATLIAAEAAIMARTAVASVEAAQRASQSGGGGSGAGRYADRGRKRTADNEHGERERREPREGGGGGDSSSKRAKQPKDDIVEFETAWCHRKGQSGKKLESGTCPVCGPPGEDGTKKWGHSGGLDKCKLVPKANGGSGDSWRGKKVGVFKDGADFPTVGSIMSESESAH